MDLLFDGRHIQASGIGIYSREQIKHLGPWATEKGLRVGILGSPDELGNIGPNLEIVPTDSNAQMYTLKEQLFLAKSLARIRPKAFWTPHYPYPILSTTRTFVTVHDVLHALPASDGGAPGVRGTYARTMLRLSLRRSVGVFVPSDATKAEIERLYGKTGRLHVAPMRIDGDWLQNEPQNRNQNQLPNEYVVFVGNVKRHKNLTGLLDAFERIKDDIQADLVLAGGAANVKNQDEEVFNRLKVLGNRVHLMGNLSFRELRDTVAGAACLVMPSFYEGVGLPPLEAMAVGTPVLASDIASLRETCGDAAKYFQPTDTSDLAAALLEVLESPTLRGSLSQRGRRWILTRESGVDPLLPFKIISERCL